jgi:hypothetical protein
MRARHRVGIVAAILVASTAPRPAYADNCGGLTDCYGTIAAAIAVVVAIAAIIAIIVFLPEILAALGIGGAAAGEGLLAAAVEAGFTEAEAGVIAEAGTILRSAEIAEIVEAHAAGESTIVNIAGRVIQYEPGLNASGMTMFGENGFLIGNEAFASEGELARTVLHELYRLSTSVAPAEGITAETAAAETEAAFNFATRAYEFLRGLL